MIPLITSAYSADEPEGSKAPGSGLLDRKSAIKILVGSFFFLVLLAPLWWYLKIESERSRCAQNLKQQWQAVQLYSVDNDERTPPAFYPDSAGAPVLMDGHPLTWASIVLPQMKSPDNFKCPSAGVTECAQIGGGKAPIRITYGLYAPMAMRTLSGIRSPDDTILIAETISNGALNSYNPKPFTNAESIRLVDDGFLIGFDSGNTADSETYRNAEYVTRLAFSDTKDAQFATGKTRHPKFIQAISVGGSKKTLTPDQAAVDRRSRSDGDLIGLWATR